MNDNQLMDRLHLVELEIMDEVNRICVKHNISYFLDSGSALGAVRHGGFIPWDDDMDVGMLRKDYDRFLEIAKSELNPGFFLQTHETDPVVYKFYCKIRKNNTFHPSPISYNYSHQGIAVDIFPFDNISPNRKEAQKNLNKSRKLHKLVRLQAYAKTFPKGEKLPLFKHMAKYSISIIMKAIPTGYFRKKYDLLCRRYNDQTTGWLTCYPYNMSQTKELFFRSETMFPVRPIRFEDRTYMIMNNPDEYLTTMYNDYMKLPPEEKRTAKIGEISFNCKEK